MKATTCKTAKADLWIEPPAPQVRMQGATRRALGRLYTGQVHSQSWAPGWLCHLLCGHLGQIAKSFHTVFPLSVKWERILMLEDWMHMQTSST